ncbi:MAG TPA: SulP family inorganic anion transporter [Vicinamibacterales bacterium]|nr:SulP family inorganic anion transporter [Vicinamibacterales bacterium]
MPSWLRTYSFDALRPDIVAGLTLAAYLLPAGIGDASLAGLPAEAGLYACLFSGLIFWILCSSRHTVVTVTSALSLLTGAAVAQMSGGDPARHAALAAALALMIGAIALAAWLARAGNAVGFFSESVLVGFKCGLALYLASTQLPKLFGFSGSHGGDFWSRMAGFFDHVDRTNGTALLIGVCALGVLLAGKLWMKNRPVAFLVVLAGIAAARLLDLQARGVALLGQVPQGLPAFGIPHVSRGDVNDLLPAAFAAFILAAVETAAIGRMFGQKHGHLFDANREFLAIGASNLAAGLGRSFPVSGGMSQSLVNESAGARTPVSGLIAALFTLFVVLFASGLLRNLPQPVLAAIVLAAVLGLVNVHALREIWHFSRTEFLITAVAFFGVLGAGPANGVLIGAALSIVLLLRQAAHPRVVELGRIGSSSSFADRTGHHEHAQIPGVVIIRCESALLYFNVDYVRDRVLAHVDARPEGVRLLVLYLGTVPHVDLAGATLISELRKTLAARGIVLHLAEAHGEVRAALRRSGFDQEYGALESGRTIHAIVSEWEAAMDGAARATLT